MIGCEVAGHVDTEELEESVNVFMVVLAVGEEALDQHGAPLPVGEGEGVLVCVCACEQGFVRIDGVNAQLIMYTVACCI